VEAVVHGHVVVEGTMTPDRPIPTNCFRTALGDEAARRNSWPSIATDSRWWRGMDRRLASRVDPRTSCRSALAEAAATAEYLRDRRCRSTPGSGRWPGGGWWGSNRHHVVADGGASTASRRRALARRRSSAHVLAVACLAAGGSSPSRALIREELLDRVHAALAGSTPATATSWS